MKVITLALFASLAACALTSPVSAKPHRPLFEPGQTIAFDGDSLTSRHSAPRHSWSYLRLLGWDTTWPDIVEDWYFCNRPQLGLKFRNSAIGGSSIKEILARYDQTIAKTKPDWVLMTTGGNDARRLTLEEYTGGLDTYFGKLKKDFGARVIIVDIYDRRLWPTNAEDDAKRASFMKAARKLLKKHGGVYVNAHDALYANAQEIKKQWDGHTVMADGGHLNAVGAKIVGNQVLQAIGAITINH